MPLKPWLKRINTYLQNGPSEETDMALPVEQMYYRGESMAEMMKAAAAIGPAELERFKTEIHSRIQREQSILAIDPAYQRQLVGGGGIFGGNQGSAGAASTTTAPAGPRLLSNYAPEGLVRMIALRMRYEREGQMFGGLPVDKITAIAVNEDEVIVIVVKDGQGTTLTDNGQFPSDGLIASIKLIIG